MTIIDILPRSIHIDSHSDPDLSGEESIDNLKFTHLAVRKTPRSGTSAELLRFEEIDAEAIVKIFNEGYSSRI